MDTKIILPICMQEEINNFMNNSLYLCILLTNENMWEWYYENYVQIFYIENKSGRYDTRKEMWLDFYGGATEPRKFFDTKDYYRGELEGIDFMKFFKERIREKKYIYTFIDESYIGGTNHNAHDFLIYGYDDFEGCFHCICFFDKKFQCVKIRYDVFRKSYQDALEIAEKFDRTGGMGYVETNAMKCSTSEPYHFNMEAYKKRLGEYINSVNSGKLYANDDRHHEIYQRFEASYGISVYDAFSKVVKDIMQTGENMDYRPFKTLYEHKRAMKKRWDFLYEKGYIKSEDYLELKPILEKQLKRAENMRFLAYRHHLQRKSTYLEEIIALLAEIRDDDILVVKLQLEVL